jgi:hypothetical protein
MEKSRLIALMNSTSPNIDGLIMAAGQSRLDRFRLKGFHTTHHFEKSP